MEWGPSGKEGTVSNRVIRKAFFLKWYLKRFKWRQNWWRVSHENICWKNLLVKGNSKCKGPEARAQLVCLQNYMKACVREELERALETARALYGGISEHEVATHSSFYSALGCSLSWGPAFQPWQAVEPEVCFPCSTPCPHQFLAQERQDLLFLCEFH